MEQVSCNLCGKDATDFLFKGKDRLHHVDDNVFNVVTCQGCGLVYLNPRPSKEEIGKYYPEDYGAYQETNSLFKYGPISRVLHQLLNRKNKVNQEEAGDDTNLRYLDFGCGSGNHLTQIKKEHPKWDLYGLDAIEKACTETKQKGFKVFCGDALSVDLPVTFFDRVNMSHVVEHLHSPQETLMKIRGSMKKGGVLMVATPNFDTPSARLFRSYWYALDTPRHLYLFTPVTLTSMLEKAGFRVSKVNFDRNPKVLLKSLSYVLRKEDLRMNPFVWRIFKGISLFIGERSIMSIEAVAE